MNRVLKPMEYMTREEYVKCDCRSIILLGEGEYKGYKWFILSYQTHPCAYIVLSPSDEYYGKQWSECDLNVHGGTTFAQYGLHNFVDKDHWVIGWDYNHYGDFSAMIDMGGKKYTTEEVYRDVKRAINELKGDFDES